jgi:hemolysin D
MTEAVRDLVPVEPSSEPRSRDQKPSHAVVLPRAAQPPAEFGAWRRRSDNEFLAPVLEILETPPSPVRLAFLWLICALVVVVIALSYFGRIDIVAAAQGKFQPTGRVKVIEPVETGRVSAIHVANDSQVEEGDILVELDRSAAEADVNAAKGNFASARAEAIRRRAEMTAARAHSFSPPAIEWPVDIGPDLRQREEQVLTANLDHLGATLASLDSQLVQKTTEREMLKQTIATQKTLVATLQDRVDMRTRLLELQSGAKSSVIDATETLQYQQTQMAIHQAQLAMAATGIDVIKRDSEKAVRSFLSDTAQKLEDAERRAEEARQLLVKAEAKLNNLTLRAPIAGRIQSSVITNLGQVVTSGQEIMRIVPRDSKLEIEAYVLNRDIGFVTVGQEAVVKVESFPFTRYGSINARVVRIAKDAIPAPDASAIEGDPTRGSNASGFAGGERTQNLVFAVELEPESSTISVDGVGQPLTSGMAVMVELKTGARRLLEYLFSPLVEVSSKAMRER